MKRIAQTAGLLVGALALPLITLAQVGEVKSTAQVQTTATAASTTVPLGAKGEAAKAKANQEIDRRIKALTDLNTRIQAMTRVNDQFKQALATNVGSQVQLLQSLKAKIAADTDLTTLKADIKSINDAYSIYRLVMPQVHISAMADHLVNITIMLQGVGNKLVARVQSAAAAGNDTTAATKALTDLATKIADAQKQTTDAVNAILPLQPDKGDKTAKKHNEDELKKAQKALRAAQQDIVAARKDIASVLEFLGKAKTQTGNASSTTSTAPAATSTR